jgi:ParB-like nuclease domain
MKVETVAIESLSLDPNNARKHSKRNLDAIAASLNKFGQRKPIVVHRNTVIAGNGTLEAAKNLGWNELTITRCPDDWDSDMAKAYALADNRSAELAEWGEETLFEQLKDLDEKGWDINDLGFTDKDFQEMEIGDENVYTKKINIPQYEIVGEQPTTGELFNNEKTRNLCEKILTAQLPQDVEEFLLIAANRHTIFNYAKIAEYYPHATPEIQELMEESALVIIDFDDAIHYGYVQFADTIAKLREDEDNEKP